MKTIVSDYLKHTNNPMSSCVVESVDYLYSQSINGENSKLNYLVTLKCGSQLKQIKIASDNLLDYIKSYISNK